MSHLREDPEVETVLERERKGSGNFLAPLTVDNSKVVPLTVDNSNVIPLTATADDLC